MLAVLRELTDLDASLDLLARHVLPVRRVDHDGVDLVRLEGRDRLIEGVVDTRLLRGLDLGVDVRQARGPDLISVQIALQVRRSVGRGDRTALQRHDRLGGVVVAVGEGHDRGALGRHRDLIDVKVELLRSWGVARGEGLGDPLDMGAVVAEQAGNVVGDGRLIAPTVRRRVVDEPWLVDRAVGGDRQDALVERLGLDRRLAGQQGTRGCGGGRRGKTHRGGGLGRRRRGPTSCGGQGDAGDDSKQGGGAAHGLSDGLGCGARVKSY